MERLSSRAISRDANSFTRVRMPTRRAKSSHAGSNSRSFAPPLDLLLTRDHWRTFGLRNGI
eukprot:3494302-Rhodomonas_salina.1